ncbi:MAG: insulinase family protein, partial [Treponema sp.]|nr:insulinase family protein [Treponema sp.]
MNLQKGQKLANGFCILDIVDLAEIGSTGIWARHEASGAEVFHILNDDSENLFSFAFATAPEDDTGVAHILEHIVLCGSKNYPLKDVFLELYQGSLQTSLNAMTSPDKTYYPASSINEHDYFNLMSIYGDAVFRPLLSRWAFLQEGCRREIVKSEDGTEKLAITGVVYNEMKGAYSSLETYAGYWSLKAVLPDTPYAFEFGGNPESIPDLDWEALKEFHRKRYSPANCRIFLAGNIPTERQLDFLAEKFFSTTAETGMRMPPVARQPRWIKPREYEVDCPAGSDSKPTVFVSWLCGETADWTESVSLLLLTEILLGHDGSPLLKPLVESGLGEDLTPVSGLERELAETVFTVGLQGVPLENKPKVEALIFEELARIAKEGIPKDDLEAALLALEFSQREIKRAGGPFSFVWMRRSFRGWMHGRAPWETLLFEPAMAEIKTRLAADPTYFEKLISRYLLENPHRALVTIKPEADFVARQEAALEEKLARTLASLTAGEKRAILDDGIELERIQGEEESDEALASIPHLSRKDLIPEVERIPRREEDLKGIPALCHELHTNGISYVKLAFPLDLLPEEDYPWFPF